MSCFQAGSECADPSHCKDLWVSMRIDERLQAPVLKHMGRGPSLTPRLDTGSHQSTVLWHGTTALDWVLLISLNLESLAPSKHNEACATTEQTIMPEPK